MDQSGRGRSAAVDLTGRTQFTSPGRVIAPRPGPRARGGPQVRPAARPSRAAAPPCRHDPGTAGASATVRGGAGPRRRSEVVAPTAGRRVVVHPDLAPALLPQRHHVPPFRVAFAAVPQAQQMPHGVGVPGIPRTRRPDPPPPAGRRRWRPPVGRPDRGPTATVATPNTTRASRGRRRSSPCGRRAGATARSRRSPGAVGPKRTGGHRGRGGARPPRRSPPGRPSASPRCRATGCSTPPFPAEGVDEPPAGSRRSCLVADQPAVSLFQGPRIDDLVQGPGPGA